MRHTEYCRIAVYGERIPYTAFLLLKKGVSEVLTEYREERDRTVIELRGEIDHHAAREAMLEIGRVINDLMPINLELDFSKVGFMDSSGIAVVVTTMRRLKEYGGRLRIVNMPAQAYKVISATGLEKLIEIKCTNEVKR